MLQYFRKCKCGAKYHHSHTLQLLGDRTCEPLRPSCSAATNRRSSLPEARLHTTVRICLAVYIGNQPRAICSTRVVQYKSFQSKILVTLLHRLLDTSTHKSDSIVPATTTRGLVDLFRRQALPPHVSRSRDCSHHVLRHFQRRMSLPSTTTSQQ